MGRKNHQANLGTVLVSMMLRSFILFLFNIALTSVSMVLILGEDVFWKLQTIDNWYTRAGTTPGDVFTLVFVAEFVIIWGFGSFWVSGLLGMIWKAI